MKLDLGSVTTEIIDHDEDDATIGDGDTTSEATDPSKNHGIEGSERSSSEGNDGDKERRESAGWAANFEDDDLVADREGQGLGMKKDGTGSTDTEGRASETEYESNRQTATAAAKEDEEDDEEEEEEFGEFASAADQRVGGDHDVTGNVGVPHNEHKSDEKEHTQPTLRGDSALKNDHKDKERCLEEENEEEQGEEVDIPLV